MSLFARGDYVWRETYFVLFDSQHRPQARAAERALRSADPQLQIEEVAADDDGQLESLTAIASYDSSAMDVCYVEGEDVEAETQELLRTAKSAGAPPAELARLRELARCNARLDVYHFQHASAADDDDAELDPGALLTAVGALAKLCRGAVIDPQSGAEL